MNRIRLFLLSVRARLLGDLDACHELGASLATGSLAIKSQRRAAHWYARAACKGHPESQYDLGYMHLLGEGVAQDPEVAVRWLRSAANAGYSEAIRVLADVYASGGHGVAADEAVAAQWATRLADHLARHPEDRRRYEEE